MKLSQIALEIGSSIAPEFGDVDIQRIADPKDARENAITFVSHPSYQELARTGNARFVIVKNGVPVAGKVCLEVSDPYAAFAKVALLFEDRSPLFDGPVHATAVIHASARVHETVSIGPYSVIGKGCVVGAHTILGAHCVIENGTTLGDSCRIDSGVIIRRDCRIGSRVIIQSGAVIGSEGFGNAREGERWIRIPSFGAVVIEDEAEIGAGTTVDRGTIENTVIGKGVKIDNLVQVAHNVRIGEHSAVAAQTGISGSTILGKRVTVGGQAGFAGHIEIGDDAFVNAQSGVGKDVPKGAKVSGAPSRDFMTLRRVEAAQMQLPEALKEIKRLRRELSDLHAAFENEAGGAPEL